jgi:hypothetical protein
MTMKYQNIIITEQGTVQYWAVPKGGHPEIDGMDFLGVVGEKNENGNIIWREGMEHFASLIPKKVHDLSTQRDHKEKT